MSQSIQVIATPGAPPAIGPYSQAIRAGDFVFSTSKSSVPCSRSFECLFTAILFL